MARSPDLINCPIISGCGVALLLAVSLVVPGCQLAFGTYNTGSGDTGGLTGGSSTSGGSSSAGGGAGAGGSTDWGDCDGTQKFTCIGANLLECTNMRWARLDTCSNVAYCEPTIGKCIKCYESDAPQCRPVGDGGLGISSCIDPLVGFSTPTAACEPPLYCAPGVAHCVLCTPEEVHCTSSTTAEVCNDLGTAFESGNCRAGCVSDGTRDVCKDCADGAVTCTPETGILRACIGGGWKTLQTCANGCQLGVGDNPATCID
jgi:hypothetical protein